MPTDDLIGTAEAAERLGIERSTLTRWVAAGKIAPALQLRGRTGPMLFRSADVDALAGSPTPEEAA